jgi:hypothetical protein
MSIFWVLRTTFTYFMCCGSPFAFMLLYWMREIFYHFAEYGGDEIRKRAHLFSFLDMIGSNL